MEHTYHITGTVAELQEILQSQFNMDQETAKLAIYLLIVEQQQFVDDLEKTKTSLWYLNKDDHFAAHFFKTRFSISFTDAKKNILEQIAIQFAGILFDGDSFTFSTILSCLLSLYRSGTYIKDNECCVYYQALKWEATHGGGYFRFEDIFPHNQEDVCCYLEYINTHKWSCSFCHGEKCDTTKQFFKETINSLRDRKVFKEFNGMYRFER